MSEPDYSDGYEVRHCGELMRNAGCGFRWEEDTEFTTFHVQCRRCDARADLVLSKHSPAPVKVAP